MLTFMTNYFLDWFSNILTTVKHIWIRDQQKKRKKKQKFAKVAMANSCFNDDNTSQFRNAALLTIINHLH